MDIKKIKTFSASRISDLLAEGQGKTRMNYIFDLAAESIGIKKDITTKAMTHGIVNEVYAMSLLIANVGGVMNVDEQWNQKSFKITDYLTATPDGYLENSHTLEAKCQYNIKNFIEQNNKLPVKYYLQVQCQMMAMNVNKGYLINYLTKPEIFGQDNWQEYPIPLAQRYYIHEIERDEMQCDKILQYSEEYYIYILKCIDILNGAIKLSDIEFFSVQFYEKVKFTRLKDTVWHKCEDRVYLHDDEFYVVSK